MQLGKTIVGAIIGGAIGIAALIVAQHYMQIDQTWMAIVVAILTGLGVRAVATTAGHASYLRGALTGILALAAYFGGMKLYSELAQRGILAKKLQPPPVAAPAEGDGETTDAEADGEPVVIQPVTTAPLERTLPAPPRVGQVQPGSPWDYVWLSIAALIAYEFGRGSNVVPPKGPVVPPPDAT